LRVAQPSGGVAGEGVVEAGAGSGPAARPILIIGPMPPPYHGVAVYTEALVGRLRRSGRPDRFLHLDTSDHRSLANLGRFGWRNAWLALRHAGSLAWLLARRRPAVVYLPISRNDWAYLRDALLIGLAKLGGSRVITHLHGSDLRGYYETTGAGWRWLVRATSRRLDTALVLGEELRRDYEGLVVPARVQVAPVGVADPFEGVAPPDRRGRVRAGLVVAYLGSLAEVKGILELMAAADRLRSDGVAVRFVLAGDWAEDAFRRRALAHLAERGLSDAFTFLGPVDDAGKRALLAEADVLVFPAVQREGLPLVILEAMAAALPVVSTRTGAVADAVADGETGYLVPQRDPAALAAALARLAAAPADRIRLGEAGRRRFQAAFTLEASVRRVQSILEAACRR
jgi:glycosyltransferase involved in cell wall biosynthesis